MRWAGHASVALLVLNAGCNRSPSKSLTTESPSASAITSSPIEKTAPAASTARPKLVSADPESDALSLIRTRRLEAKAEGRVLVVYVGATWCEPCKRFKAEIESGRLDDRLAKVTLLAFDADKDGDRLNAAGYTYRFIPFVALPGADGHPSDMQQATGKGGGAWRELLGKLDGWQQPL